MLTRLWLWLGALAAFLAISALVVFGPWGDAAATAVIAHRGASHIAPENTVAALSAAIDAGADIIEVDVRLTSDGVPVLLHDATLERTTDVEERLPEAAPWRVSDLSLDDIHDLDAGSWKGAEFAGEPVPSLDEALVAVGPDAALLIELKAGGDANAVATAVAATLEDPAVRDVDVAVQSFDVELLNAFEKQAPDVPTAIVTSQPLSDDELDVHAEAHEGVTPNADSLDQAFVDAAQERGLAVRPYTVNDPRVMRQLINWGVDGIITDRPERLREVVDRQR